MNEKLAEAMGCIADEKVAEAAARKKSRKPTLLRAIAAGLVIALLLILPGLPMAIPAQAVATASGSNLIRWDSRMSDQETDRWRVQQRELDAVRPEAMEAMAPFLKDTSAAMLAGSDENRIWSPVNGYIALAMLAEVTDGSSRQQILDLLNAQDLDALREYVWVLWEEVYWDNGHEICTLANSLWLDKRLTYEQAAMDNLSNYHYASVYRTDLGSSTAGKALRAWLNNNTGGMLRRSTAGAAFPEDAVLTLASTVYLQSKWSDEFSPGNNTKDTFHAPSGDRTVEYMNKKLYQTTYFWGDSFGAVRLSLKNRTDMWFFLPDADKTVDDVLAEGQYLEYITHSYEDKDAVSKYMKVNLTVPKFDISSSANLAGMLKNLGVTDVFDPETANFTAITADTPVFLTAVNQAARIIIDEQGVKAAAYIEIPGAGAAQPPEEIIDFILDRPFVFVIADYNGIPIFTGVVNEP